MHLCHSTNILLILMTVFDGVPDILKYLMYRIFYSIGECLVVCYTICSCSYRFLFNGVPDS